MNTEILERIYEVSGLSKYAPAETIIKRDDLKKIIDAVGIRNTLSWINREQKK